MEGVTAGTHSRRGALFAARSQRWVFDLQACQTAGSAHRGVGRYSQALFDAIRAGNPAVDVRAVVNDGLPHAPALGGLPGDRVLHLPPWPDGLGLRKAQGGPQDDIESILYAHRLAPLKADLIHVSHVFEGFGGGVALPSLSHKAPGQVVSATLHDLIPLLYPDHYFRNPEFALWYRSRLDWLRHVDLLIANSDSSRNDAIDLLGIDPVQVVAVHGGVGPQFVPVTGRDDVKADLRRRYDLRERFVLYTGGDDYRKNIDGGIRGYAELPLALRRGCQLVVVCAMDDSRKAMYADIGRRAGLADGELVLTGFVPDDDLVAFYQCCDVFVFPSLYEGLGLPVLEAMACGAPTLGGDNSSVRELIGRPDALFDSGSSTAIAAALHRALTDAEFVRDLSAYGLERAAGFTWQRSGELAAEAMAEAVERAERAGVHAARNGWLPKKRLAVLSPLPPCRSGIADYNARFLPHLSRYFDIDLFVDDYAVRDDGLTSTFPVFGVRGFDKVAARYDAILYEFGNSEFHSHMLPLLKRFPGIVGLHDAFLSGLIGYVDFNLGDRGSYPRTMISAHGPRARRYYAPALHHPEPTGGTMVDLPCTKPVIDAALGVVSHSPFNLEVARSNHPEGWQAPYRTIPQMVEISPPATAGERAAVKAELGFGPSAVVIATFGHITWTKWGDRLLQAFLASPGLRDDADVHLAYVGELAADGFGQALAAAIETAGLGSRIRITGFLDEARYERFLRAADVAIQLRTKSRGGTPKGVLDCLAHGVPVIVNDDASYRDYPAHVAYKLPADPAIDDIAAALDALGRSADLRRRYAERGRQHVRDHHDPGRSAAMYAAMINECIERARLATAQSVTDALAPLAARCADPADTAAALARCIEARVAPEFHRRRIYVDVSFIAAHDHESGIQRVVKKIVHHFVTTDMAGVDVVVVVLEDGRLHVASSWLAAKGLLHPAEADSVEPDRGVSFGPGDILFMLDSSWDRWREFEPVFAEVRGGRGSVVTAVYDLLPVRMPAEFVEGGPAWFKRWLVAAVKSSDAMVAISRATASDLQRFIDEEPGLGHRPKVGFWHLGSDIGDRPGTVAPNEAVSRVGGRPYLLMVGTIEPRKSHELALDAMERLWASGSELGLTIAGKQGWMREAMMARLRGHEERGHRLELFEHPSDTDINHLYRHASGLLFLSKGEGFGLPLVEAANHGLPVVCSDLPVFREICGDHATYLRGWTSAGVAAELVAWWARRRNDDVPSTADMPRLTWEQSATALLDVLLHDKWLTSATAA